MELDLIDTWLHCPGLLQVFKIWDGPVAHANVLDLATGKNVFHLSPSLAHVPLTIDSSGSIGIDRQQLVRLFLFKLAFFNILA